MPVKCIDQGILGVVAFVDDRELTGVTEEEHLDRLDRVLQRIEEHCLKLQMSKCEFLGGLGGVSRSCLLYTSPSPRD